MNPQRADRPDSRPRPGRRFGLLLLAVGLAAGAAWAWHLYQSRPLNVAETRKVIRNYLEEKAGVSRFQAISMEVGATNGSGADASTATEDEAGSKKAEKKKKKKSRSSHELLAREFRRWIKESPDYKTTYRLIGENLARVDELQLSEDPERIEDGLALAAAASRAALDPAVDGWLAARIAEAYLWPNLEKAPASDKGGIDPASLLDISEDAFEAADELDNLVRNYRLMIARGDQPGKTDKFRVRLAKVLESQDNFAEALRVLRQVQDTNNPSLARHISGMESMVQQTRNVR